MFRLDFCILQFKTCRNKMSISSISRFIAIYFMRREISMEACRRIIVIIWAYSLILTSPWAAFFTVHPDYENPNLMICSELWPIQGGSNAFFFIANLFLCYLFPLFLITLSYAFIFNKVSYPKKMSRYCH